MSYAFYDHNTALNPDVILCQVEHPGKEGRPNPLAPCWKFWKVLCTYHGQLGLKLNFQGLQSPVQLCDLTLGGAGYLSISGDLCLQRCTLNKNKTQSPWADERRGSGFCVATGVAAQRGFSTCLLNCSSASRRLCSASSSYCALMSFSNLVRSVPGAAFISTVTPPPELPCIVFIS